MLNNLLKMLADGFIPSVHSVPKILVRPFGFLQYCGHILGAQGGFYAVIYEVKDLFFAGKAHFHLRRMNVYIHGFRRNFYVEHAARIFAHHGGAFERLLQCDHCRARLYKSSVYKKILKNSACFGGARPCDIPLYGEAWLRHGGIVHLKHIVRKFPAVNGGNCREHIAVAVGGELRFTVTDKAELHLRIGKRNLVHNLRHGVRFGNVFFQEFLPCRGVIEKVAHNNGCALRTAGFHRLADFAVGCFAVITYLRALRPREHLRVGNRRYGSQSLSAKAECANSLQIAFLADFAGGVAQKCFGNILFFNSAAVIRHADKRISAVFYLNGYIIRSCINSVFHKLLHHGAGSVHHFSCGYKLRNMFIKYIYSWHFIPFSQLLR